MLPPESAMYLLVPDETNQRVLLPGRIAQAGNDEFVAEFEHAVAPPPGSDVNIFFELNGRFMQQGASIIAIREPVLPPLTETEREPLIAFKPAQAVAFRRVGDPISAETRGSFRVSVIAMNLLARLDNERKCRLADISPEGFALITTRNYRLGTIAQISFDFEDSHLEGRVRVQTAKLISGGRFRCGFLVPTTEKAMRSSLQRMTFAVQRQQLRRLRQTG